VANDDLPKTPTGSRFGWPRPTRMAEFAKLLDGKPKPTMRIVFQGKTIDLPIIRVPIELPKYRLENGRTASLQAEYMATPANKGMRADLFSGDPELWDAQEAQHGLLLRLAKTADLLKYFEDATNKQIDPILLDENGFVVNGNRRLSTWRQFLHDEPAKYGHFRHIDVAVLPHSDEKEIDRLEANLQIAKDIKADYTWDARANMMRAKQKHHDLKMPDLAEMYGMKEGDIEELFDMRDYAEDYLSSRGKANMWSEVSDHEFAFRKIVNSRPKISGSGAQEIFKQAAFTLIQKPSEAGGRLYEAIPAVMDNIDAVKAALKAEFPVPPPPKTDDGLGELLGGAKASSDPSGDLPLAQVIQKPENAAKVRRIIVDVLETQRQLKKDDKEAGYLLDCCAKAQASLSAAVKSGLRSETKREGVADQLAQIEAHCATIRKFLDKK
jgi:hypothetical protein